MGIIYRVVDLVFTVFELALIAYVLLSWIRPSANRWTELLRNVVEPVLKPVRRFLVAKLPRQYQFIDWSPLVVFLALSLIRRMLVWILW